MMVRLLDSILAQRFTVFNENHQPNLYESSNYVKDFEYLTESYGSGFLNLMNDVSSGLGFNIISILFFLNFFS